VGSTDYPAVVRWVTVPWPANPGNSFGSKSSKNVWRNQSAMRLSPAGYFWLPDLDTVRRCLIHRSAGVPYADAQECCFCGTGDRQGGTVLTSKQDREIAELRERLLVQSCSVWQIVEAIIAGFDVPRLKAHRLARGWTRPQAIEWSRRASW
jgi:hypothetical protein